MYSKWLNQGMRKHLRRRKKAPSSKRSGALYMGRILPLVRIIVRRSTAVNDLNDLHFPRSEHFHENANSFVTATRHECSGPTCISTTRSDQLLAPGFASV